MDEENINIMELVLDTLNRDDLWFTQKTDPTYQEASSYYELDEFGDPTEKTIKKIEKEVNSLIGDGAIDIIDAIELWKNDQIAEFRLDFRDNLVTKFEPKPVVDNIKAYENSVQFPQSKKIEAKTKKTENMINLSDDDKQKYYIGKGIVGGQATPYDLYKIDNKYYNANGLEISEKDALDDMDNFKHIFGDKKTEDYDVDTYNKEQAELKREYRDRIVKSITPEIKNAFNDLRDLLDEGEDKTELDGFYFPSDAITVVDMADKAYHLNSAMDLTTSNILNMVGNNDTIEQAIDELFADYDAESAYSWADNFITVLGKLDFDIHINENKSFGRALRELKTEAKQDKTELTPEQKANKIANIGSLVGKAKYPFQLNAVVHTLSFVDQDLSNKLRQTFNPATIKQDGIEDARNGIAQMIFDETGVDVLAPNMEFATESKNVNFNKRIKDKKDDDYEDLDESKKVESTDNHEYVSIYDELNSLLNLYVSTNEDKLKLYNNFNFDRPLKDLNGDNEDVYYDWLEDFKETNYRELRDYLNELEEDDRLSDWRNKNVFDESKKVERRKKQIEAFKNRKANFNKRTKDKVIEAITDNFYSAFDSHGFRRKINKDTTIEELMDELHNFIEFENISKDDTRKAIKDVVSHLNIQLKANLDELSIYLWFINGNYGGTYEKVRKNKITENYQRRLEEVNNKSANTIKDILQSDGFDSESNAGKIVLRTQDLFTALSDLGLDVDVTFDNGDSTSTIQLGTAGGKVVITINDPEKPLKAFMSGNVELTGDSLEKFQSIEDRIKTV